MIPVEDPGYRTQEGVLSEAECRALAEALSQDGTGRSRAGARHLMSHPVVARIARDPRLLSIAQTWVGCGAVPYRATLFEKSGEHNWLVVWHQDTALPLEARLESPEWGPWSTKRSIHYAHAPAWALSQIVALRLHLDPSTLENGPLKVIPGSHDAGVLSDEEVFRAAKARRSALGLSGRGGVLAMRPLLIHSSSKTESPAPRRVLHLEYAAALDLAPGVRLAIA
jgi:ectoine hydroxylase-related dioxygenase (phytanoyl-CoA dioxygenase family)